jgi:hypothetical protein
MKYSDDSNIKLTHGQNNFIYVSNNSHRKRPKK